MAVELKNRIESDLGLTLPVTALLQDPSLAHLGARLMSQLAALVAVSAAPVPPPGYHIEELLAKLTICPTIRRLAAPIATHRAIDDRGPRRQGQLLTGRRRGRNCSTAIGSRST